MQSREGSHVDRTRHCRGADSRSRRRTYSPYKPPSKWQTLPICHCEAPKGPWQSREGSYDFADSLPGIRPGTARLPRRFAPRNDKSGVRDIFMMACSERQCRAGRGMPLPYNGGYHETAAGTGRQCLPEIAPQGHFLIHFSVFIHFRAPPLQRTPRQGAKKAPIFRSELHVGVTYLPVQSPAKYCRRK